ncbi:MAG: TlpA family protein disulfide reductase [Marinisporobacter sp.]|nr:TlpA family protein disulfide reductase [Marinisporobacter sp.]
MYKKRAVLLGVILLGIVVFFIFVKNEEPKENLIIQSQKTKEKDEITKEEKGVFVGDQAYDFTLLDREGNEIKLSDLKGKVVFLNFFTTWCGSCAQEMRYIQEVYEQYKEKDIVFLVVNVLAAEKKDVEGVNEFLDEKGYTFPILYDVDGNISVKYKVNAFPATYIINQEGIVEESVTQSMEKEVMIEKIENTLNK